MQPEAIDEGADLTADEARELTDRIRVSWDELAPLVTVAYRRRAWVALGYESWDAYCSAEMDGARLALPVAERRERTAELRDAGMSTRAIGSALGVDPKTVRNDLASGGEYSPPEQTAANAPESPRTVTGTDGRNYPARPSAPVPKRVDRPAPAQRVADPTPPSASEPEPMAEPPADHPNVVDSTGIRWVWSDRPDRPGYFSELNPAHIGEGYPLGALEADLGPLRPWSPGDVAKPWPTMPPAQFMRNPLVAAVVDGIVNDSDPASELRRNLNARIESFSAGVLGLDPGAVADAAGHDLIERLQRAHAEFGKFIDEVTALRRRRSGLKVVRDA